MNVRDLWSPMFSYNFLINLLVFIRCSFWCNQALHIAERSYFSEFFSLNFREKKSTLSRRSGATSGPLILRLYYLSVQHEDHLLRVNTSIAWYGRHAVCWEDVPNHIQNLKHCVLPFYDEKNDYDKNSHNCGVYNHDFNEICGVGVLIYFYRIYFYRISRDPDFSEFEEWQILTHRFTSLDFLTFTLRT